MGHYIASCFMEVGYNQPTTWTWTFYGKTNQTNKTHSMVCHRCSYFLHWHMAVSSISDKAAICRYLRLKMVWYGLVVTMSASKIARKFLGWCYTWSRDLSQALGLGIYLRASAKMLSIDGTHGKWSTHMVDVCRCSISMSEYSKSFFLDLQYSLAPSALRHVFSGVVLFSK